MGERNTPDGFWDRQERRAAGPSLEEQEKLRACSPTGDVPADQWAQDGKVWDDEPVNHSSNEQNRKPWWVPESALRRMSREAAPLIGTKNDAVMVAAHVLDGMCAELLERRQQTETTGEVVARGGDRVYVRLDNGEHCAGELVAVNVSTQKT